MKFTNALDDKTNSENLKKALVEWVLGTDGEDGATCRILDTIPWTDEMESVIPWGEFDKKIDEAIGSRGVWTQWVYDLVSADRTGLRMEFDNFISEKVAKIYGVYATIIDALNKKVNKKYVVLKKFVGVDSLGVCQYVVLKEFTADTYFDAISEMWGYIKVNGISCDWDFNKLVDALYTFNGSVAVGYKVSAHLIK